MRDLSFKGMELILEKLIFSGNCFLSLIPWSSNTDTLALNFGHTDPKY